MHDSHKKGKGFQSHGCGHDFEFFDPIAIHVNAPDCIIK